ncbi:MAG: hypothetical protein JXR37_24515 [Kiritimatiellae bacterium]|nr:hypothetical protein [Kiritimatiellia bacterium]
MKTALILCESAADLALDALQGRTPLQVARCEHATHLAALGQSGVLEPLREGFEARNEVRIAALLGAAPEAAAGLRRAPLEALGLDADTGGYDAVYRGDLLTVDGGRLASRAPGRRSAKELPPLVAALQEAWDPDKVKFVLAGPWTVLVMAKTGAAGHRPPAGCAPLPMLESGCRLRDFLPAGKRSRLLRDIIARARDTLAGHEVNQVRVDLGENPANFLWLWGGGAPLESGAYGGGRRACLFCRTPLAKGLGRLFGMTVRELRDPWQEGRAAFRVRETVTALRQHDFTLVYVDSPAAFGGYGTPEEKVRALEHFDQRLLGPFFEMLEAQRPYRLLLASEGLVSTETRHPVAAGVPVVLAGHDIAADPVTRWDEGQAAEGLLGTVSAEQLCRLLA